MMTATVLRRSLLAATSIAAITVTAPAVAQEVDEDHFRIAPERASVVNTHLRLQACSTRLESTAWVCSIAQTASSVLGL